MNQVVKSNLDPFSEPFDRYLSERQKVSAKDTLASKPDFRKAALAVIDADITLFELIARNPVFKDLVPGLNESSKTAFNERRRVSDGETLLASDVNDAVVSLNSIRDNLRGAISSFKTTDANANQIIEIVKKSYAVNSLNTLNTNLYPGSSEAAQDKNNGTQTQTPTLNLAKLIGEHSALVRKIASGKYNPAMQRSRADDIDELLTLEAAIYKGMNSEKPGVKALRSNFDKEKEVNSGQALTEAVSKLNAAKDIKDPEERLAASITIRKNMGELGLQGSQMPGNEIATSFMMLRDTTNVERAEMLRAQDKETARLGAEKKVESPTINTTELPTDTGYRDKKNAQFELFELGLLNTIPGTVSVYDGPNREKKVEGRQPIGIDDPAKVYEGLQAVRQRLVEILGLSTDPEWKEYKNTLRPIARGMYEVATLGGLNDYKNIGKWMTKEQAKQKMEVFNHIIDEQERRLSPYVTIEGNTVSNASGDDRSVNLAKNAATTACTELLNVLQRAWSLVAQSNGQGPLKHIEPKESVRMSRRPFGGGFGVRFQH